MIRADQPWINVWRISEEIVASKPWIISKRMFWMAITELKRERVLKKKGNFVSFMLRTSFMECSEGTYDEDDDESDIDPRPLGERLAIVQEAMQITYEEAKLNQEERNSEGNQIQENITFEVLTILMELRRKGRKWFIWEEFFGIWIAKNGKEKNKEKIMENIILLRECGCINKKENEWEMTYLGKQLWKNELNELILQGKSVCLDQINKKRLSDKEKKSI
ncbi:MAG: hypothetical protein Ta2E_01030 [Mycoplasmoidaceae bacterium]|nr:MAG: hypothetical protein Ta2E_01030 [Mycoplasmoidaceae bacterium]